MPPPPSLFMLAKSPVQIGLSTSLRRIRELNWIKELGTSKPYGFNHQIKGLGTLSSTSCKKTNIYELFNKHPGRKRSHGKRHYKKKSPQPESSMNTLVDMVDMMGRCAFSVPFPQLRVPQELALESDK